MVRYCQRKARRCAMTIINESMHDWIDGEKSEAKILIVKDLSFVRVIMYKGTQWLIIIIVVSYKF